MHFVTRVDYETEYKLILRFEDDSVKIVDLAPYLEGEIFEPLRKMEIFRTAHLDQDIDTVVWENGADMSPDFLYQIGSLIDNPQSCKVAEGRAAYGKDVKR